MFSSEALPWATSSLQWKQADFNGEAATSKTSYVLSRLRNDILAARLRPNEKLYLKVLTARYETSVAPVREALAVLAGAGLVLSESQRGFRVAPASPDDFIDIARARILVEMSALQMSIKRGDQAWKERIHRAYRLLSGLLPQAGSVTPISDDWEVHHREFHFALVSECGSPTLLNFWSQLHDRFDRYRRLTLPTGAYMAETSSEHQDIMDKVIGKDEAGAVKLITEHIQNITAVVLEQYCPPQVNRAI